jgi:hypothetical protein
MTGISADTERPSGMTGVYWLATCWTECFAVIDDTNAASGAYQTPQEGNFTADPALTGKDDCGCDAHREIRDERGKAGRIQVTVTVRELMDRFVWSEACGLLGLNSWAVNEGQMDSGDRVTLTLEQARTLGLLENGAA